MPDAYSRHDSDRPVEPVLIRLRSHSPTSGFPTLLLVLTCFGLLVLFAMACATVLGALGYYQVTGRILPGVKVGNLDLGGMTQAEAKIMLDKTWSLDTRLQLSNGSQSQERLTCSARSDAGFNADCPAEPMIMPTMGHSSTASLRL